MKQPRKILALLLCAVMLVGLLPTAALAAESNSLSNFKKVNTYKDDTFSDVSVSDWYYDNVKAAYELGLMIGQGKNFGVNSDVTIAETVTLAARIHSIYSGDNENFTQGSTWYQTYVNYVEGKGLVNLSGFDMGAVATRAQYAYILGAALPDEALEGVNSIADNAIPDVKIGDTYASAIYRLYRAGILTGGDDQGTYSPNSNIKRSEVAAIVTRMADTSLRKTVTLGASTYTVTLYLNDGTDSVYKTITVEEGQTLADLLDPTRSDYKFNGWYTASKGGSKFDIDQPITSNTTLYARWENTNTSGNNGGYSYVPYIPYGPVVQENYTVSFDSNGGSAVAAQTVPAGKTADFPAEPEKANCFFVGWYNEETDDIMSSFDFSGTPITKDIQLHAKWFELVDADEDKLIDDLEAYYGTDINNPDTDGDGLSDYIELFILGTDPLNKSTNGVDDATADADDDGLGNLTEIEWGTDPGDPDTDADGLGDAEESSYGTDPLKYDTDDDGASDGTEVRAGTDPTSPDSEFNINLTTDAGDTVIPSVNVKLDGDQVETLSIAPFLNEYFFPDDMPGYLGKAYTFDVDGSFDSATISFDFEPAVIGSGAEPTIFYFNEEQQTLEELPTVIEGNRASTTVNHFSTYVLIDRVAHYDAFTWEDAWSTEASAYNGVEIALIIDDSGSMDLNDPSNIRLEVAQDLIDSLPASSKIGVVKFEDSTTMLTERLTEDRAAAKSFLTTNDFFSYGGTYMYRAINDSFSLFESNADNILKMIVVLSDGDSFDTKLHQSTISAAIENNIHIYAVGLGNDTYYFNSYLRPLAEQTDGAFYLAANAEQLVDIYDDISKKIDLEANSDGDSIPDYYEEHMIAFNGRRIEMDKYSDDTDGDGLQDDREVEVSIVYNEDRTKVYVKGKLKSFPDRVDSDNDGISDKDDPTPMVYTITERTLAFAEGLSYTDLEGYVGKTLGYAIDHGVNITGISRENAEYLREAVIVHANNGGFNWGELRDFGLRSIGLKIVRNNAKTAVIYSIGGTQDLYDGVTDILLGAGWDSVQSRTAFEEYKRLAANRDYDYYITGHSLGGRLALDVLFKIYNANEGGLFRPRANIKTPKHSVTFNALGYNKVVYASLWVTNRDVLDSLKSKISNYYYWNDIVGEGLGTGIYSRTGTNIMLICHDIDGNNLQTDKLNKFITLRDATYHGIDYFQNDYQMLYTSPHSFGYWVD